MGLPVRHALNPQIGLQILEKKIPAVRLSTQINCSLDYRPILNFSM
jgi:hypothetical protein